MFWKDVDKESKSFLVDYYSKDNLAEMAFADFVHTKGYNRYWFSLKDIKPTTSIEKWGLDSGFELLPIPKKFTVSFKKDFENQLKNFEKDFVWNDCYIALSYSKYDKTYNCCVYSKDESNLKEIHDRLLKNSEPVIIKDDSFNCEFSFLNNENNRQTYTSVIKANKFSSIQKNYPTSVVDKLNHTMELMKKRNNSAAKLIILNGPAGAGKTHFIRSLVAEMKEEYDIEFSLEPKSVFSSSGYLVQSLLSNDEDPLDIMGEEGGGKGKILIMEDVDDILSESNKQQYGDLVSKFLNLLDGFIGQGKDFFLIVTANTEHAKFHKAVLRPGRCLSYIEFDCFSQAGGEEWLKNMGLKPEEYAEELKKLVATGENRVGFRSEKKINNPVTLSELFRIYNEAKEKQTEEAPKELNAV